MGNRDVTKQIRVKQWAQIIQDRCASGLYVDEYCEQHLSALAPIVTLLTGDTSAGKTLGISRGMDTAI